MSIHKVLLADDHQMVVDGMVSVLKNNPHFEVVGTATNGLQVLDQIRGLMPNLDIVVMDISMPDLDGIETTRILKDEFPDLDILIVTMHKDNNFIRSILEIGASGYILKGSGAPELMKALQTIVEGGTYFSGDVTKIVMDGIKKNQISSANLTKRELEVLKLIAQGLTNKQIAEKLIISQYTAETHRKNITKKLKVNKVTELVKYAMNRGLI